MEWVVLSVEFLLLLAGWLLFQQAKSELTARATEAPVLAEITALQKSISALMEQLKLESTQASAQLESRCVEARDLLAALDRRLEALQAVPSKRSLKRRPIPIDAGGSSDHETGDAVDPLAGETSAHSSSNRCQSVYAMADDGIAVAEISQQTGYSLGEIELILGLRQSVG